MNSTHTSVVNCSIPIQYEAILTIKDLVDSSDYHLSEYVGPVTILAFFFLYPIITYFYLTANLSKLDSLKHKHFQKMHQYAFENIRYYRKNGLGLSYNLMCHYRRSIYAVIMVLMSKYFSL